MEEGIDDSWRRFCHRLPPPLLLLGVPRAHTHTIHNTHAKSKVKKAANEIKNKVTDRRGIESIENWDEMDVCIAV